MPPNSNRKSDVATATIIAGVLLVVAVVFSFAGYFVGSEVASSRAAAEAQKQKAAAARRIRSLNIALDSALGTGDRLSADLDRYRQEFDAQLAEERERTRTAEAHAQRLRMRGAGINPRFPLTPGDLD